jgi:hypothetical protein
MTVAAARSFRTVAFGDVDGRLWGAAVDAGAAGMVFGSADASASAAGQAGLAWDTDGRGWRLRGDGFELLVSPRGEEPEPPEDGGSSSEVSGVQELCDVRGTISLGGVEHSVDCAGTRTEVDGIEPASLQSARSVSGFFGDDAALTLLALRPRRATHHDSDLIAATLFDPDGWVPVADPRLSTTYSEAGLPMRTSLELWVGDGEDEFPRRAAGEAASPGAEVTAGQLALRVAPLRCHSRGSEGAGVYVLASF